MKLLKSILLASGGLVMFAAVAHAADLPTKKAPVAAPPPNCFATFMTWLDSTAGDCPLSFGPLTAYGQIDVGGSYQTNGAKFNPYYTNGVQSVINKQANGAKWLWSPNNLSQSNLGLKLKQKVFGDVNLIGDINFGFDPYSLQFANGPASLYDNNKVLPYYQTSNADSSRAGGIDNSRAYLGFASATYGTLTAGRQNTLSNSLASAYDPNGGAYAFSLIGYSSSVVNGTGDTETARYNTSIQYVYDYQKLVHVGAIVQLGGYNQQNGANGAYQIDVGGNYAGFSLDAIYSYAKDAVALSAYGGNGAGGYGLPKGVATYDLKATLADINAGAVMLKYQWQQLGLYGGYVYENFSNPSDSYSWGISNTVGGYAVLPSGITNTAYTINKVQQIVWVGAKYAVRPDLDVSAGFYDLWQNNYSGGVCVANTVTVTGAPKGATTPQGDNTTANNKAGKTSNNCSGNEPVVSALIDWRPWKRVDTYAGVTWSEVTGGIAAGYIKNSNTALTAGVRVSF